MLREALTERLKAAMRAKDARTLSTVRLILAGLKERDIAASGAPWAAAMPMASPTPRSSGCCRAWSSSAANRSRSTDKGNRPELAAQEEAEIAVIESFLPQQMGDDEIAAAAQGGDRGAGRRRDQGHGPGDGRACASAMPG